MLARLVLPSCIAGLVLIAIWVVSPYLWAIFWTGLAAAGGGVAWTVWHLRATGGLRWAWFPRPFATSPVPALGPAPERKVIQGHVLAIESGEEVA